MNQMQRPNETTKTAGIFKVDEKNRLQFWESEATRPIIRGASAQGHEALERIAEDRLPSLLSQPFRAASAIRYAQFERIQELVARAYEEVPFYAERYRAAGFRPWDLASWEDFERLPVITKDDLLQAGLGRTLSSRWPAEDLFATRTFGTSGKTLLIRVNLDAIVVDTLQGVRQFWLQSGLRYAHDHMAAMIYTLPWWFESVGDEFRSAFVSGVIPPQPMAEILAELDPHVMSCYPTNLKALLDLDRPFRGDNLHLAVVHSEYSSPHERRAWGRKLGVPVRNEYSTEEATRIALELPCGHHHVCDDAVYLEVLNPETMTPQAAGKPGVAVVTNLLNEAMPFIRYVQGDYVTRPASPARCLIGWSQLDSIDGRINDSFADFTGREVPAGTILDVVYRWMFDADLIVNEFELVQSAPDAIRATFMPDCGTPEAKVRNAVEHLRDLLTLCLGCPVKVTAECVCAFPRRPGKRRPIRREFAG